LDFRNLFLRRGRTGEKAKGGGNEKGEERIMVRVEASCHSFFRLHHCCDMKMWILIADICQLY